MTLGLAENVPLSSVCVRLCVRVCVLLCMHNLAPKEHLPPEAL